MLLYATGQLIGGSLTCHGDYESFEITEKGLFSRSSTTLIVRGNLGSQSTSESYEVVSDIVVFFGKSRQALLVGGKLP